MEIKENSDKVNKIIDSSVRTGIVIGLESALKAYNKLNPVQFVEFINEQIAHHEELKD